MTAMPREVARKRPANMPTRRQPDDGRTIDGQWRAVRGGMTGTQMLLFLLLAFVGAGLLGLLLSLMSAA